MFTLMTPEKQLCGVSTDFKTSLSTTCRAGT